MALDKYLVPWFLNVLARLDEATFHRQMSGVYNNRFGQQVNGKDFLGDLQRNHSGKWRFLMMTRRYKGMFSIDVGYQMNVITTAIAQKGWRLLPHETECFRDTLTRLNMIMNG
jgi:hypothetical protein